MNSEPSTVDFESLLVDSLQSPRCGDMHGLYYQAVNSMSLEHVNHFDARASCPLPFRSSTTQTWLM